MHINLFMIKHHFLAVLFSPSLVSADILDNSKLIDDDCKERVRRTTLETFRSIYMFKLLATDYLHKYSFEGVISLLVHVVFHSFCHK